MARKKFFQYERRARNEVLGLLTQKLVELLQILLVKEMDAMVSFIINGWWRVYSSMAVPSPGDYPSRGSSNRESR